MKPRLKLQEAYFPKGKIHSKYFFLLMGICMVAVVNLPTTLYGFPLFVLILLFGLLWMQKTTIIASPSDFWLFATFVTSTLMATLVFPVDERIGLYWPVFSILSFVSLGTMVYKQENDTLAHRINHFLPQTIMYPTVVIAEALTEQTGKQLAVYSILSVGIPLFWAWHWFYLWRKDKVYKQPEALWFIGLIVTTALLNLVNLEAATHLDVIFQDRTVTIFGVIFVVISLHLLLNFSFIINSGTYIRHGRNYKSGRTPNLEVALFTLPIALIIDAYNIPHQALIVICVGTIVATLTILASFHAVYDVNTEINTDLLRVSKIDVLTGLSNVQGLITELERLKTNFHGSVVFINIVNDLAIRDTYGQRFGDSICTEVASRLNENRRKTEILARVDTNTFMLLSENLPHNQQYSTCLRIKSNLNIQMMHPQQDLVSPDIRVICYSVGSIESFSRIVSQANLEHEFPENFGTSLNFELVI